MSITDTFLWKVGERLSCHTPADNWRLLQRKRTQRRYPSNTIAPELMANEAVVLDFLRYKAHDLSGPVQVWGEGREADLLCRALDMAKKGYHRQTGWPPSPSAGQLSGGNGAGQGSDIVVCTWAETPEDWEALARMRTASSQRVLTLSELLLPLTVLMESHKRLPYKFKSLAEMMPYYTGRKYLGPIDELNQAFPLADKRIVEFGPMGGYQTAALVNLGAERVLCVEARAENALKTLAAKAAFGWDGVEVVMDDFHNVSGANYGRFDLAFAHGVYYHSFAPMRFFQNLFSLADHIFFGGYVTEETPPGPGFVELGLDGATYWAKEHADGYGWDQGVNTKSYYFTEEAVRRLFETHGYRIIGISNEEDTPAEGPIRYLRFLASREQRS
ncbi:MAG: class I SAM-dependent methyltransferase [Chloroflexi bacterium]|nr:class I SAM-dependent methyltransferase [Chloroflexota bacterium]